MAILSEEMTDVLTGDAVVATNTVSRRHSQFATDETVDLGIWLSGLDAYLGDGPLGDTAARARLIRCALERCIRLNARVHVAGSDDELSQILREGLRLSALMTHSSVFELRAWQNVFIARLRESVSFHAAIAMAEASGEDSLPGPLGTFVPKTEEEAEFALVLPRFGKILKWLNVVSHMLEADEPLKPAIVILARVKEQIAELIAYINNRLERFSNEDAEIFGALDAASYTASLMQKKVFGPHFAGLVAVRSAPAVYAAIETAYSTLNEAFQQMLAGLARIIDPSAERVALFPQSRVNFERSLALRRELMGLVRLTHAAEEKAEAPEIEALHEALRKFTGTTIRFLYYKDTETFERFVEEILVTQQTKDLVPILHRFGAYLETLFGQVSLRAVLENHPFEAK